MRIKDKIDGKFTNIYDIDVLSKYIKQGIYNNFNKHMSAFTFYFEFDNHNEIHMMETAYSKLIDTYNVFFDLDNKVFSIKW